MMNNEKGRSMIEMLGVLAIVGILSVSGISGYNKAMTRVKVKELSELINQVSFDVRSQFINESSYAGVSVNFLISTNAVSQASVEVIEEGPAIRHKLGGNVLVFPSDKFAQGDNKAFELYVTGIPRKVCSELVTIDWGVEPSSGLQALYVDFNVDIQVAVLGNVRIGDPSDPTSHYYTIGTHENSIPLTLKEARDVCNCTTANNCVIGFKYS